MVAQEVKDMELNREIFDIDDCEMETNPDIRIAPAVEFQESDTDVEIQKSKNVDAEELIQVLEDHKEESKIELVLEPASCTVSKNLQKMWRTIYKRGQKIT